MPRTSQLSTRSDAKELSAYAGGALAWQAVLDADAEAESWRIVEAYSLDAAPFELEVSWSAGAGAGSKARITLARAGRISVFARGLRVRAANLSGSKNRVGVNVADGFAPSRNVWEVRGSAQGGDNGTVEVEIPPFAEDLTLEAADPDLLPSMEVRLYDGLGTLRAKYAGDAQLQTGIDVGGAGKVEVVSPSAADFRVVFHLSL
jgi:hypothetical protein